MRHLTDTKIKRAKPKDKIYKLFDGDGLYLEVKPNGKKTWRVKYRLNGKEKTYTIGEYPLVTLAKARAIAREVKEKVLQSIDPLQERQKKEKENKTFAIIAEKGTDYMIVKFVKLKFQSKNITSVLIFADAPRKFY